MCLTPPRFIRARWWGRRAVSWLYTQALPSVRITDHSGLHTHDPHTTRTFLQCVFHSATVSTFPPASFLPSFRQTQLPGSRLRASTFIFTPHTFNPHKLSSTWNMYVQRNTGPHPPSYSHLTLLILNPGRLTNSPLHGTLEELFSASRLCSSEASPLVFPPWKIIYCSPTPFIPPKLLTHQLQLCLENHTN